MKLSDTYGIHDCFSGRAASVLQWLVPLLLIVPNVALDITEQYTALERAVNILVPAGAYLLLMSLWRRPGIMALCLFPVMFLCAFQIVLLWLYGESVIAIDMFLNVATTNTGEASELLLNLGGAIVLVCLLYLPPVALGIIAVCRRSRLCPRRCRQGAAAGTLILAAGLICLLFALLAPSGYRIGRKLFPVNAVHNMLAAIERTRLTDAYESTAAAFSFEARRTAAADTLPEVYVLVIGETSRADNWQLNGYGRPTTPRLAARDGLVSYPRTLSESNTTHKSVPLMMSHLGSKHFNDSIYCVRSIIDAFSEAGFTTAWLSNQRRNGALIDFFGSRADTVRFITDDGADHYDMELCPLLRQVLDSGAPRVFAVLHTYGSHFNYRGRYPADCAVYGSGGNYEASAENRDELIDEYDNTILYTDRLLDSVITIASSCGRRAAVVYASDHGEDIFDDSRGRFLHASPTPTFRQLHVPMLIWMSDAFRQDEPEMYAAAKAAASDEVSSSRSVFHTLVSMAGITTPYYDASAALTDSRYKAPERLYLNDYNEGVALEDAGLRRQDFDELAAHGMYQADTRPANSLATRQMPLVRGVQTATRSMSASMQTAYTSAMKASDASVNSAGDI